MAKKKDTQEEPPEGVLVTAAKTIGKAAGKIASSVDVTRQTKSVKVPKLAKKDKARFPRRLKKALRKAGQL